MHSVFPAISPFLELVKHAEQIPDKILVRDHYSDRTATAGQLLQSVAFLREKLQGTQRQNGTCNGDHTDQGKFYYLIAAPGLEYVVSMLTIFSIGGVMSAQCKQSLPWLQYSMLTSNIAIIIKPEDMLRLFQFARPGALLYASSLTEKVEAIKALCAEHDNGAISNLPFLGVQVPCLDNSTCHTYETGPMSESISSQNGTLFFTSGTSGKQKGVLHSYPALLASAQERIGTWKLTKNDVFLNQKPGNWMGGIFGIIPSLMSGACL